MDSIDNIVDKALDRSIKTASRKMLEEPKHILVHRWFKTWKMFKYETSSEQDAYAKFNKVMEQLMQLSNVLTDSRRSRVYMKNITPDCIFATFKYVVEVYWRDKEPRNGQ